LPQFVGVQDKKDDVTIDSEITSKYFEFPVAGGGHDEDLLIAYRAIEPLLKNYNINFKIRYGGNRPEFLLPNKKIDFATVNHNLDVYPQKVYDLKANLAIAPLRDTSFNRCKSNL